MVNVLIFFALVAVLVANIDTIITKTKKIWQRMGFIPPDDNEIEKFIKDMDPNELTESQKLSHNNAKKMLTKRRIRKLNDYVEYHGTGLETPSPEDAADAALLATAASDAQEDRRALDLIGKGDIDGGLDILVAEAKAADGNRADAWRRIAEIAYPVSTARAIYAYDRVVALGSTAPWDLIYLSRL